MSSILVTTPILFFGCKKTKEYHLSGVFYYNCWDVAKNKKFYVTYHDPYHNNHPHDGFKTEYASVGEFTTDNNGHFDAILKELKNPYIGSETFIEDELGHTFGTIQQNTDLTNQIFRTVKSFPIYVRLQPSSVLSNSDTLYFFVNYPTPPKKIPHPVYNQFLVDTIYDNSLQTTASWAIYNSGVQSSNGTITLTLPSNCGDTLTYNLVFP